MKTNNLDNIVCNNPTDLKVDSSDYIGDNGLLMCGKCNTPKEFITTFTGRQVKVRCLCECETKQRDLEEKRRADEQRQIRIKELKSVAFNDEQSLQSIFANDDGLNPYLSKVSRRYVEKFKELRKVPKGLLFFGTVGTGKTFYASCIANALIDKGYTCVVTNFSRIVNTLSSMKIDKQEYIDDLCSYDLLIIDDLSAERNTEYMNEIVMNVVDSRYRAKKPIIITTNLTSEELKNPKDISKKRIYSRLLEMCYPIEVKGNDHRREKLKQDFQDIKEILESKT